MLASVHLETSSAARLLWVHIYGAQRGYLAIFTAERAQGSSVDSTVGPQPARQTVWRDQGR